MAIPETKLNTIDIGETARKLTASISEPLEKLYTVGGYVLVFTFVGLILMLVGYFTGTNSYSPYLFGFGAGIEVLCFVGIFIAKAYAQRKTNILLRDNQDLIKTILELANKLTDNLSNLQSLLYKNAEFVAFLLQETEPILSQIPVLKNLNFSEGKNVNAVIFDTADKIREVVENTRLAISDAKIEPIKHYVKELDTLKSNLREALRSENSHIKTIDYKSIIKSYQTAILEYSSIVETTTEKALVYINDVNSIMKIVAIVPGIGIKIKPIKKESEFITLLAQELHKTTKTLNISLSSGDLNDIKETIQSLKGLSQNIHLLKSKNLLEEQDDS